MIQRKRILQQSGIFLKQNPGEAHLTIDELREMADRNNANLFLSKISRYVGNIAGTNAYWNRVRDKLKAIIINVGPPTLFFTFSSADMLSNDPDLCQLTQIALKGFLAQKMKDQNDLFDTAELDQDIEAGHQAANTVCQYVDWLLSTVNPNPPDDGNWIRPEIHPCQRQHSDICDHDTQSDYVDLLNMVQRHTRCNTGYCLRKKANESELN